jgi:transketolase
LDCQKALNKGTFYHTLARRTLSNSHNILSGLGESISRALALNTPAPQVCVNDSFGESRTPEQLIKKYKLNNQAIVEAVEKVIKRK